MNLDLKRALEKQGYRTVGNHSAVKVCLWCKKAIRGEDTCYKNKFYGIKSWRCVQMSPAVQFCQQRCKYCWRNTDITFPKWQGLVDEPSTIIDGCIEAQCKILQGFKGNSNANKKRFAEAMKPKHFALSLAGDACLYPKLPEMLDELRNRDITSFLVTNGCAPKMLERLIGSHEPTQLYISLSAPNKKIYLETCNPIIKDGWEELNKSLSLFQKFSCRTVNRLTLVKGLNLKNPKGYAELIEKAKPMFVECKAFMSVGGARKRLEFSKMPSHQEIREFAQSIADNSSYKIIDEKRVSRVVLLSL